MIDQRLLELSSYYVADRLAAAEKERLLRSVERRRAHLPACAAWAGGVLVRAGRRLQVIGGAAQAAPSSVGMRQGAL